MTQFQVLEIIFWCLFTSNIKSNVLNANFLLKNNQKTGSSKITVLGNFGSFECVDITKNHEIFQKSHETDSKLIKIVFNQWKIVMFDWKIINRSWFWSKIMLNQNKTGYWSIEFVSQSNSLFFWLRIGVAKISKSMIKMFYFCKFWLRPLFIQSNHDIQNINWKLNFIDTLVTLNILFSVLWKSKKLKKSYYCWNQESSRLESPRSQDPVRSRDVIFTCEIWPDFVPEVVQLCVLIILFVIEREYFWTF